MKPHKKPIVLIVLGRPGSGKDTQADLLAKHYNLIRIETSKLIQEEFNENLSDPETKKEKENFDNGRLCGPPWIVSIIKKRVSSLDFNVSNENGIIFSGSPRTIYEVENALPFFEEKFGKENIAAVYLNITAEEGMRRILKRNARELDRDPEILKVRMNEFNNRTAPILDILKNKGILFDIDGMPSIEIIFQNILKVLNGYWK